MDVSTTDTSLLQAFLDASPNATFIYETVRDAHGHTADFRLTMLNRPAEEWVNQPGNVAVGQRLSALVPDWLSTDRFRQMQAVADTGRPCTFEVQRTNSTDGQPCWAAVTVAKFNGGLAVTYNDITDRKRAELSLQEQVDIFDGVLRTTFNGLAVLKIVRDDAGILQDLIYEYVSNKILTDTGYTREQLTGRSQLEFFPGVRQSTHWSAYEHVAATGQPQEFEEHYYYDGFDNYVWVQITALGHDRLVVTYHITNDIKRAQREAEQQAGHLRSVLNSIQTGVGLMSPVRNNEGQIIDFRYEATNAANARITGLTIEQMEGHNMAELLPGTVASGFLQQCIDVVETGQTKEFDLPYQYDGLNGWYNMVIGPNGEGIIFSSLDITDRKQAELEQQRQRDLLQSIVDNVPMALVLLAPVRDSSGVLTDFQYQLSNRFNAEKVHKDPSELMSGPVSVPFPGWQQLPLFERLRQVADTKQPIQYVDTFVFDDVSGWFNYAIRPLGESVLLTYTDISPLKQAELDQQRQRNLLQSIVDDVPMGIVLADTLRTRSDQSAEAESADGAVYDFRYVLSNHFNASRASLLPADLNGRDVSAVFPGWQGIPLFAAMQTVAETGQAYQYSEPYEHFGINGWFDFNIKPKDNGVLVTYADVTPIKEAELAQKRLADHLQNVLDSALAAIAEYEAIRNEQGKIVDFYFRSFNQAAEQMTGLKAANVVGGRMLEMFPMVSTSGLFERWANLVETGEPLRFVDYYADGDIELWYDTQAVKWDDGFIQSYVDISAIMRKQREAEAFTIELKRSNEHLQQFAYVASHDLQEPLRKIQAFADVISERYGAGMGTEGIDYLKRMQQAANRMQTLIRDLLAYSRLSTERQVFRAVNLANLVRDVIDDLDVAVTETGATLDVATLPTLDGDRLQLQQLFQNLISNALKFRREGVAPVIKISFQRVKRTEVPTGVLALTQTNPDVPFSNRFVEISVQDNGIGFDEKYLDRIFQVFQRLHGKGQYAGTGVGLAICRKAAENHGGGITARSQPGKGTTFLVYLPG